MTRNVALPLFPRAPREYNQQYQSDLVRAFDQYIRIMLNPGEGRNTFTVFTDLQTDDIGLEEGSVYRDGNVLKVSLLHIAALRGASTSTSTGTVTVSIT